MMPFIVDRNDSGRGLTGAKAQDVFKRAVPVFAREHSAMDVVMLDNAGDKCQEARQRQQVPLSKKTRPLDEK